MSRTAANRTSPTSGFTMVELMVGMTMSSVIILAVLSAFLYLGRNLTRLGFNKDLETSARTAMGLFKQDTATAASITTATTNTVVLAGIPLKTSDAYYPGTQTVTYTYTATVGSTPGYLNRQVTKLNTSGGTVYTGTATRMMSNLTAFNFRFYDSSGGSITGTPVVSVKRTEFTFTATLGSSGAGTATTFAAVSPRTALRNKPLLQ